MEDDDDDLEEIEPGSYFAHMGVTQCLYCEGHLYPGTFFHYCGDIVDDTQRIDRIVTKTGVIEIREDLRTGLKDLRWTHFKNDG